MDTFFCNGREETIIRTVSFGIFSRAITKETFYRIILERRGEGKGNIRWGGKIRWTKWRKGERKEEKKRKKEGRVPGIKKA